MKHKINKKFFFSLSLLFSAILGMFVSTKKGGLDLVDLITEVPLGSIERVYADAGGGDCSCGCDALNTPDPVVDSGVTISIKKKTAPNPAPWTGGGCGCGGCGGGGVLQNLN